MRQFLLVIVLVAAAFGGGALVSGPGFRWAQEHLLDYMGLKDGGEIDSLELTPPPGAQAKPNTLMASSEPPRAPEPKPAPAPAPAATADLPVLPEPKVTEPFKETQAALAGSPATPTPTPAPAAEPAKGGGGGGPALLGALSSILTPAPAPAEQPKPKTDSPPPLDLGVAPSSLPAAESSTAATGGDWAEIRRKLAAAGVSKYQVEGDPSGRVVFSCLIPLAGKQAVSQRFEAEGDDEVQAAQSVLKRINLWRASQPVAPGSQ
ncbi:hypothetical protein [Paludisphaera rhizosphaerae]|uniref:hypothetical protein n=1 Tax=Paludisphaera rhizosphaerae TaxID=2711216 RepID=UPI0013EDEB2D|nr:hypothetical protein [Paludisphaera rhizosphaerae]